MAYATGSTGLAITVRGSSRRIMIMRFRPANIRLINRRSNLLRLLLALSSGNNKSNDKKQTHRSRRLTRSLHIRASHSSSRSLTWDRGLEMAKHKSFTVATKVNVYFCDPQSPWQRGTNENTNGLLLQYFPRKTDLSGYSQSDLDKVVLRLNQRPRKTLGFETPASKLQASVASTV